MKANNYNNKNGPNRKGFTLVELITVLSIVAALTAIIVPNLLKLIEKSNNTRDANEAKDGAWVGITGENIDIAADID